MSKGKDRIDAAILFLLLLVLGTSTLLSFRSVLSFSSSSVLLALADKDASAAEQNRRAICAPIVWTACVNLTLRSMVNRNIGWIPDGTR